MLTYIPNEKHNRYSEAIIWPSGDKGSVAFIAGQWGLESARDTTADFPFEHEVRACFAKVSRVLADCRMNFANVVRLDVFLSDLDLYEVFASVRSELFAQNPPTATLTRADLLLNARVEISAIAIGEG